MHRTSPGMIVEVLSESTRRLDQQEKLNACLTLSSLREYLLIDQDRMLVQVYRKSANWTPQVVTAGAVLFECLDVELFLDQICEDIPFPAPIHSAPWTE